MKKKKRRLTETLPNHLREAAHFGLGLMLSWSDIFPILGWIFSYLRVIFFLCKSWVDPKIAKTVRIQALVDRPPALPTILPSKDS